MSVAEEVAGQVRHTVDLLNMALHAAQTIGLEVLIASDAGGTFALYENTRLKVESIHRTEIL